MIGDAHRVSWDISSRSTPVYKARVKTFCLLTIYNYTAAVYKLNASLSFGPLIEDENYTRSPLDIFVSDHDHFFFLTKILLKQLVQVTAKH